MESFHEYSTTVSKALDTLGYSYDCIKTRQAWYNENYKDSDNRNILAGSKAEGVTSWLESYIDIMGSLDAIACCEDIQDVDPGRYLVVFVMDRDNVAPGYTRLRHVDFQKVRRLFQREEWMEIIVGSSFQNENGDFLLSSEFLSDKIKHDGIDGNKDVERAGPAITLTFKLDDIIPKINTDWVIAIPLKCKSILHAWISRPRHHDWPSREVIQEISTMDGHVVPVGVKGTDKQYEEWRICYTQAEITLIRSFNETQLKLYVLLKMVAKKLLKPVCPDITSYIIKNIMFWLAEQIPCEMFRLENLMGLLMLSLRDLIIQVDTECLENYMIPERNLFAGKLEQPQKQALLELLASLIREGPTFILQYPELDVLRSRMVQVFTKPELALYEQRNREEASRFDDDENQITCIAEWNAFCADKGVDPEPIKGKLMKLLLGCYN